MDQMTPMLRQYLDMKSVHPDSILFFRLGDFYEMFFEDAERASKILGITLTSRGNHNGSKVPMCGVPYHSVRSYIFKLIEEGLKVAICEQVEDPSQAKGIVRREVVRVVTPGSIVDESGAEGAASLYMAAISGENGGYGLAFVDLSTGEFRVTEVDEWRELVDELGRIVPAELLVPEADNLAGNSDLSRYRVEILRKERYNKDEAEALLKEQLCVRSLDGFGCAGLKHGVAAAGAVVYYLKETQKVNPSHINDLVTYRLGDYMFLDESSVLNLELFETVRRRSQQGSLFKVLDRTITPMGGRLLKRWIAYPLVDPSRIRHRLAAVADFREDRIYREDIREELKGIYDLERLNGRVSLGRANARDLEALKLSVTRLPSVKERLAGSTSELLSDIGRRIDTLPDIAEIIEKAICDDPPVSLKEGGIIREGYNKELDELISISRDGKSWIAELAQTEKRRTGISNLKIGYNRVFGYYIEISKGNLHLVPSDYIR
ncbi:MAG: DNA mismatch repair protein MutS, partial [Deltaproteobacteria bacterium]|nr:DNA mismatch repair protein MutS [Deltaproteobacteria bacterium]